MLPSLAFGYGKTQGLQIETGSRFQQASFSNKPGLGSRADLRYLGKAGEHIFLLDGSSKQLIITSLPANQQLFLNKASLEKESTPAE